MLRIYRGDIFTVRNYVRVSGSEQAADRPAVIVSNNMGNEHSEIVEVVYLTSREKKPLPTHVSVLARVPSTALCEQIHTISKDRLCEFIRSCTDEEMAAIDKALAVSLGLFISPEADNEPFYNTEIVQLKSELDNKNTEISDLLGKLKSVKEKYEYLESQPVFPEDYEPHEITVLTTQRDMYKQQYEMLLDRMIGR